VSLSLEIEPRVGDGEALEELRLEYTSHVEPAFTRLSHFVKGVWLLQRPRCSAKQTTYNLGSKHASSILIQYEVLHSTNNPDHQKPTPGMIELRIETPSRIHLTEGYPRSLTPCVRPPKAHFVFIKFSTRELINFGEGLRGTVYTRQSTDSSCLAGNGCGKAYQTPRSEI
jgi:hypothetical protein